MSKFYLNIFLKLYLMDFANFSSSRTFIKSLELELTSTLLLLLNTDPNIHTTDTEACLPHTDLSYMIHFFFSHQINIYFEILFQELCLRFMRYQSG